MSSTAARTLPIKLKPSQSVFVRHALAYIATMKYICSFAIILILVFSCKSDADVMQKYLPTNQITESNLPKDLKAFEYANISQDSLAISILEKTNLHIPKIDGRELKVSENFLKYFKPTDALSYVLNLSNTYDVIIINEAHHINKHKSFIYKLIDSLKYKDYNTYFGEALNYGVNMDSIKFVNESHGFYLKNPISAQIVTKCHNDGWNVFGYESVFNSGERELEQAKNIAQKIKQLNGKVIIHCGYGHGSFQKGLMGWHLQNLFPQKRILSIDQTTFTDGVVSFKNDLIKVCDSVKTPSVLINKHQEAFMHPFNESHYSLQIVHPNQFDYYGYAYGAMEEYTIEEYIPKESLLFVYETKEGNSASYKEQTPFKIFDSSAISNTIRLPKNRSYVCFYVLDNTFSKLLIKKKNDRTV